MKPEDQIKAAAELDGWNVADLDNKNMMGWITHKNGAQTVWNHLDKRFPYLTSYDAIIPVIRKQVERAEIARDFFLITTQDMLQGKYLHTMFATPAQLTEALLRVTGKWTDS